MSASSSTSSPAACAPPAPAGKRAAPPADACPLCAGHGTLSPLYATAKRRTSTLAQHLRPSLQATAGRATAAPAERAQLRRLIPVGADPDTDGSYVAVVPLKLRPLEEADFGRDFLAVLSQLTDVGTVSQAFFNERAQQLRDDPLSHMLVVEDLGRGRVCAAGTLVVEPKFIHQAGLAGHIEDVVVDTGLRRRGLGRLVVKKLQRLAREAGCYKVIVDCSEENVPFYTSCGFTRKEVCMALYFDRRPAAELPGGPLSLVPQARPVPAGHQLRFVRPEDYNSNFLALLSQLSAVGELPQPFFLDRLRSIERSKREYMVVIEALGSSPTKLVAAATLLVEYKFIHEAGKCGHIEDVVVDSSARGLGLGKIIIRRLVELAHEAGCYKVILDCSEKNVAFYNRCGFTQNEVCMAHYFDKK